MLMCKIILSTKKYINTYCYSCSRQKRKEKNQCFTKNTHNSAYQLTFKTYVKNIKIINKD